MLHYSLYIEYILDTLCRLVSQFNLCVYKISFCSLIATLSTRCCIHSASSMPSFGRVSNFCPCGCLEIKKIDFFEVVSCSCTPHLDCLHTHLQLCHLLPRCCLYTYLSFSLLPGDCYCRPRKPCTNIVSAWFLLLLHM